MMKAALPLWPLLATMTPSGNAAPNHVWVYPLHREKVVVGSPTADQVKEGYVLQSPYYSFWIENEAEDSIESFAHYTVARGKYSADNPDGHYVVRNGHLDPLMQDGQVVTKNAATEKGTNFSFTTFSFKGAPVTVRIELTDEALGRLGGALRDCKVLPSSANATSRVEGNAMVVTINEPVKIAVIPNYAEAIAYYGAKAAEIGEWKTKNELVEHNAAHEVEFEHAYGGYKYPALILARGEEAYADGHEVPDPANRDTLLIHPGDRYTTEELHKYRVLCFAPGYHDLRLQNDPFPGDRSKVWADDDFRTPLAPDQVVYLAGGAYVFGSFKASENGRNALIGRGIIQPILYSSGFALYQGITSTERYYHQLRDITGKAIDYAATSGWTGNTGGFSLDDGAILEDFFIHAEDDLTHIRGSNTTIRNGVMWENRAHAIMVQINIGKTWDNILVEDVAVIYHESLKTTPQGADRSKRGYAKGGPIQVAKARGGVTRSTFRNITVEAPHISKPMSVVSPEMVENVWNFPSWYKGGTENQHARFRDITFENIQINSVLIHQKGQIWSHWDDGIDGLTFKNFRIRGELVTEGNFGEYFETTDGFSGSKVENIKIQR